jgi:hypothetical protein
MEEPWIVHIIDLPGDASACRCVRCGQEFDNRYIDITPPGAMLAVRPEAVPPQWRPIFERDDLMPDEISCDRLVGRD